MAGARTFMTPGEEHVAFIRKSLGTNEKDIAEALLSIREWLDKQTHLPNDIDDDRLERLYISCKCSLESLKLALEARYSLKHKYPELLMNRDPLGSDVLYTKEHIKFVTMPHLTADGYRVHYAVDIDPNPETYRLCTMLKMALMVAEVMLVEDYNVGEVVVIDTAPIGAGHLLRTNVHLVRAVELCCRVAYGRRIKAVHLVNAPKIIDGILRIVKNGLSEKMQKRILTHLPGSRTLLDHLHPVFIPDELGGKGGSVEHLQYALFDRSLEYRTWLLSQDDVVSDESKRPPNSKSVTSLFGVEGSFKRLDID